MKRGPTLHQCSSKTLHVVLQVLQALAQCPSTLLTKLHAAPLHLDQIVCSLNSLPAVTPLLLYFEKLIFLSRIQIGPHEKADSFPLLLSELEISSPSPYTSREFCLYRPVNILFILYLLMQLPPLILSLEE